MSSGNFTISGGPTRIDIECQDCGTGMNTSRTQFGLNMVDAFTQQHKCPKGTK